MMRDLLGLFLLLDPPSQWCVSGSLLFLLIRLFFLLRLAVVAVAAVADGAVADGTEAAAPVADGVEGAVS